MTSTESQVAFLRESAAKVKQRCPDVPVIHVPQPRNPMDQLTFNLTREQFEQKRREAAQKGFTLAGDKGTTPEVDGVKLDYDYTEPVLKLAIHCNFIVRAFAEKSIKAWLAV